MPTPRRDLPELRTEAAATLATPDIRLVARVELPADDLGSFAFSPDGRTLLTAGRKTGLDFWDVPGQPSPVLRGGPDGERNPAYDKVVYLPDGQGLAVGTRDQRRRVHGLAGIRTTRAPITRGSSRPTKLAISADGQRIAVAWTDGAGITVHDAASGALARRVQGLPLRPSAPTGDGSLARRTSDVVLLPIGSGEPRVVLGRHGGVRALAFSPDGAMLAAPFDRPHHDALGRGEARTVRHPSGPPRTGSRRGLQPGRRVDRHRESRLHRPGSGRHGPGRTSPRSPVSAPVRQVNWSPTGDYLAMSTTLPRGLPLQDRGPARRAAVADRPPDRTPLRGGAPAPGTVRDLRILGVDLLGPLRSPPLPGRDGAQSRGGHGHGLQPRRLPPGDGSWRRASHPREVSSSSGTANTGKVRSRISVPQIVYALAFDPTGERLASGDAGGAMSSSGTSPRAAPSGNSPRVPQVRSIVFLDGLAAW